jgi:predicted PurR-regulated permease PerM
MPEDRPIDTTPAPDPTPTQTQSRTNGSPNRSLPVWLAPAAWLVLLILILYFFGPLSTVMLGVLAACIIACTLRPIVDRFPLSRAVGLSVVGVGMVAIVVAFVLLFYFLLSDPIANAANNWPETKRDIDASLAKWSRNLGMKEETMTVEVLVDNLQGFLTGSTFFSRTTDIVLGILLSLAFSLVGSLFLLGEPPQQLINPGLRLLPPRYRPSMASALADLEPRFRAWAIGTLTGMGVVFCASSIGYSLIGLKMAIPLALLAGFAEIIPTVGPAIACLVAALVAGATQGGAAAGAVLFVWGCIQALEAYVILPMIMKGAVNIHPAITLFTVVLWGKIFGVAGLILAIPINLTIWTMLDYFRLKPTDGHTSGP